MKSSKKLNLAIGLPLALVACCLTHTATAEVCPLQVQVTPTHKVWNAGEPVEIQVRFNNQSDHTAKLALLYPSLGGRGFPGITFTLDEKTSPANISANAIESLVDVAAHSSWTIRVYINKFIPALTVGANPVHWLLEIACLDARGEPLTPATYNGRFTIQVNSKPTSDLAALANTYVERLDSAQHWKRQEAIEALSNMSDPAALPALQKLYLYGFRNDALQALRKFDGNPEAARLLVNILKSADASAAPRALQLAAAWHSDLEPALLDDVFASPNQAVKLALIAYLGARRSAAYSSMLQRLAGAPDSVLAQAAQAALSKPAPSR